MEEDWFEQLHNKRKEAVKVFKDPEFANVFNGVIDKYSETAHFIYELLQNADDAKATKVRLVLCKDKFIFSHNGSVHFTVSNPATAEEDKKNGTLGHINSITAIGFSSKDNSVATSENKIGKFGVGFKAVFQYTQTPMIYDRDYCFKIEDYIVPTRISDREHYCEGETVFVLPFNKENISQDEAYEQIENRINNLDYPQLFLNYLQTIEWQIEDKTGCIAKQIGKKYEEMHGISSTLCNMSVDKEKKQKMIKMARGIDIPGRGKHEISIVYFIDRGRIDISVRPNIHCFFPTNETIETCYIIHAPFALVDNRQQIKKHHPINELLLKEIAALAADSLLVLRDISIKEKSRLLGDNIMDLCSYDTNKFYNDYRFLQKPDYFGKAYQNIFDTEKVFLTRRGKYTKIEYGWWADEDMRKLLDDSQFNKLTQSRNENTLQRSEFILCSIKNRDRSWLETIGVRIFTDELLAECITDSFMAKQPQTWLKSFYRYVIEKRLTEIYELKKGQTTLGVMRQCPIIKNEANNFVAPYIDGKLSVFINIGENGSIENTINETLYSKCSSFRQLLEKMGVKAPKKMDEFRLKLNKLSTLDKEEINKLLIGLYTHFVSSPDDREEIISLMNNKFHFLCKSVINNDVTKWCLSSEILDQNENLVKYFTLANDENAFVIDFQYYQNALKATPEDELKKFIYTYLRFIKKPKIVKYSVFFTENDRNMCPKECSRNTNRKIVTEIDGIYNVIGAISNRKCDKEFSLYVWNIICDLKESEKDVFIPDFAIYTYYKERKFVWNYCSMKVMLQNSPWLYKDGELVSINSGVYREDLERNGYKKSIMSDLEIEDSPNVKDLETINTLSEEGKTTYALGQIANELGIKSKDELIKLITIGKKQEKAQKEKEELVKRAHDEYNPLNNYIERRPSKALEEKDFTKPDNDAARFSNNKGKGQEEMCLEEVLAGFEETANLQKAEIEAVAALREKANNCEKYSYKWLLTLIDLESRSHGTSNASTHQPISISFQNVLSDAQNSSIIILKGASRNIPSFLEDIEDIPVSFHFHNGEKQKISFEAASVNDDTLILKSNGDVSTICENIKLIAFADINIDKPIELIRKWKRLIESMKYDEDFSLKLNLRHDLKFIFGPPGTGKTTTLARRIIDKISMQESCKILVLAPTNKACDVLAAKILRLNKDFCPWIGRFVTTMDENLEKEGIILGRDFNILDHKKICVVSTMARYSFDGFDDVLLRDVDWDYVIIDEASMIPTYQIIAPLYNEHSGAIVIAGDPFQNTPIVNIDLWKDENIYSMVGLNDFVNPQTTPYPFEVETLLKQYRSIPAVGNIYSEYLYGGKLQHQRTMKEHRVLSIGFDESPLNIVSFPVTKDSIFAAKRLMSSNIQIYSIIFTAELLKYIVENVKNKHPQEEIRIGVIGPYNAEIQAIEKLYMSSNPIYDNVKIICGTVHGFQGDECDIVIAIMNPPASGLKRAADMTFVNNKNIINVAVSRARDYFFMLMPSADYENFNSLYEIKRIGQIMTNIGSKIYTSDKIEKLMFGDSNFIEKNSFVTSHQMTNVYGGDFSATYEVRIDDKALDIQLNK